MLTDDPLSISGVTTSVCYPREIQVHPNTMFL